MVKALICNQWELDFTPETLEANYEKTNLKQRPHFRDMVMRPMDQSFGAEATHWMIAHLPQNLTVTELMGGSAMQSVIIQALLKPAHHRIIDINSICTEHIRRNVNGLGIEILCQDAYSIESVDPAADIYFMDHNSWTIKHWPGVNSIWYMLLERKPLAIIWPDHCKPYFHIHRGLYSKILGKKLEGLHDYTDGVSTFLTEYGYHITKAAYGPKATYYMAQPSDSVEGLEEKTFAYQNNGFKWLLL